APGYAYTPALREVLCDSFDWFADLLGIRTPSAEPVRSTALCLGSSTALKRRLSPALVRAAARGAGGGMRVDIHPGDFDFPGHVMTLERLLDRAREREP